MICITCHLSLHTQLSVSEVVYAVNMHLLYILGRSYFDVPASILPPFDSSLPHKVTIMVLYTAVLPTSTSFLPFMCPSVDKCTDSNTRPSLINLPIAIRIPICDTPSNP